MFAKNVNKKRKYEGVITETSPGKITETPPGKISSFDKGPPFLHHYQDGHSMTISICQTLEIFALLARDIRTEFLSLRVTVRILNLYKIQYVMRCVINVNK